MGEVLTYGETCWIVSGWPKTSSSTMRNPPQIPRLWTMLMWCVVFGSS